MLKRIDKYNILAEVGDILPQKLCQWAANYPPSNGKGYYNRQPIPGNGWYKVNWPGAEMRNGQYIAKMAIIIHVPEEFQLDPTYNEWGEIAP